MSVYIFVCVGNNWWTMVIRCVKFDMLVYLQDLYVVYPVFNYKQVNGINQDIMLDKDITKFYNY
jgi:hypothetical protein